MEIVVYQDRVCIRRVWCTVNAQNIVREICSILLEKGYRVYVFFTGEPVVEAGGLSIDIVIDKVLSGEDYEFLKKTVSSIVLDK